MGKGTSMRAAVAVPNLVRDRRANLSAVVALARQARDNGADLVLFPEMALSGFLHDGVPAHDYQLAVEIGGEETDRLSGLARDCAIYLAIGLLERQGSHLYDSALLFGPDGRLLLVYRRISPAWHPRGVDPAV